MPHRASLEEAAEGHPAGRATTPDLEGVTHIPESQLPRRHDRMGAFLLASPFPSLTCCFPPRFAFSPPSLCSFPLSLCPKKTPQLVPPTRTTSRYDSSPLILPSHLSFPFLPSPSSPFLRLLHFLPMLTRLLPNSRWTASPTTGPPPATTAPSRLAFFAFPLYRTYPYSQPATAMDTSRLYLAVLPPTAPVKRSCSSRFLLSSSQDC